MRAQEADDEVPMRHLGSMWQGHISKYEQTCGSQAPPCKSSTSEKISEAFADLTQAWSRAFSRHPSDSGFVSRSPSVVSEATAEERLVALSESAAVAFDTTA